MSAASASGGDAPDVRAVWRACDAVCFDVDSTVCVGEGIDELAEFAGRGEEVRRWTTKAMDGNVSFRDALSARLTIIEPSKMLMDAFLESSPPQLSAGMLRLSEALRARGKEVFLVSGGFRQMIEPVARIIGIADHLFVEAFRYLVAAFARRRPCESAGVGLYQNRIEVKIVQVSAATAHLAQ